MKFSFQRVSQGRLNKVAITGGLASGKSSASLFFGACGAYVVSADEIVHRLLSIKTNIGKEIVNLLGQDIVDPLTGNFNRKTIAKRVFKDVSLIRKFENILHPKVEEEIKKEYLHIKENCFLPLFVAEIPLLFETNMQDFYDFTVSISSDEELCKKRFKGKDFGDRMKLQLSQEEKNSRADFVITNNNDLDALKKSIVKFFCQIT